MPVPATAKIQVFFTGQLVLYEVDKGKEFQVGVNREADDHEFAVIIIPTTPGDVTRPITLPSAASQRNISLEVVNPLTPGVRKYGIDVPADPLNDPQTFANVINIDGPKFNPGPLHVASGVLTPSFFINNGLFYAFDPFYATVTRPHQNPGPETIAFVVGANIDFKDNTSSATLSYFDGGSQTLDLSNKDTTYQIWVENLDFNPSMHSMVDHFQFYYRAFDQVAPGDRGDVSKAQINVAAALNNNFDSHAFPCNPVFSSQSPLG
jgi:hypothetical protein